MRAFLCASSVLLLSTVLALTYRVDPEGGPDTLADEVQAAFDAWSGLDDTLEITVDAEATTLFGYGADALFGPDTLSLTVQRQDPARVDVQLHPTGERTSALLHETGLVLGVSVKAEGVMNPALGEEAPSLGELEAESLRQELDAVPEDLNVDGKVDFYDLVELAKSFGQSGFSLRADIDESGVVDEADLERLREAYNFSSPSSTPPAQEDILTDEPLPPAPGEEQGPGETTGEEGEARPSDEGAEEEPPTPEAPGDASGESQDEAQGADQGDGETQSPPDETPGTPDNEDGNTP